MTGKVQFTSTSGITIPSRMVERDTTARQWAGLSPAMCQYMVASLPASGIPNCWKISGNTGAMIAPPPIPNMPARKAGSDPCGDHLPTRQQPKSSDNDASRHKLRLPRFPTFGGGFPRRAKHAVDDRQGLAHAGCRRARSRSVQVLARPDPGVTLCALCGMHGRYGICSACRQRDADAAAVGFVVRYARCPGNELTTDQREKMPTAAPCLPIVREASGWPIGSTVNSPP